MIQIRSGVFETNSSSTHSICITADRQSLLNIPDKLVFKPGEYGWEHNRYGTTEEKASYLYSALAELYDAEELSVVLNDLYCMLTYLGVDAEFEPIEYWDDDDLYPENADIDHPEDLSEFVEAVLHGPTRLKYYLFSPDSYVLTGNDNNGDDVSIDEPYRHETFYKGN